MILWASKKCPGMKKSTIFVREYVVGLVDDPKQCCDLPVGCARKAESALAHAPDADGVAKFYELGLCEKDPEHHIHK